MSTCAGSVSSIRFRGMSQSVREPALKSPRWYLRGCPRWYLSRTYVILVLPKCLLTWGYVEGDAAAFCLQHEDRRGENAGPVEI